MGDNILASLKDHLGVSEFDKAFDDDIILHTNSAFSNLYQIGIDNKGIPFKIENGEEDWVSLFESFSSELGFIKEYTFLKVKLLFDPPTNSSLLESLNKCIQETEYRLQIQLEGFFKEDKNADSV